jgi:hypothetical protein
MSLRLTTPFINTNIPGAYPNVNVISQPVGLGNTGVLVIFGEAAGGPSYSEVSLANQFFTPDQLQMVQQTYISGPIVDAFSILAAPSNDRNIVGTANQIYIAKTNTSEQASAILDQNSATYGTLTDKNYGINGNLYQYQVISTADEVAPNIQGGAIPTAYTFTVTAANATAGAIYSNNSQTFTVTSTIVAGTTLITIGTGAPLGSGTLTKVSGTGDATIAFSAASSSFGGALVGASFSIRLNGGASTAVGPLSGPITNVATLVTSINNALSSASITNVVAAAATADPTIAIQLSMASDSDPYSDGWGKSFELVDSSPGDLAALGLAAGLTVSSQEPSVEVNISRTSTNTNEQLDASALIAMQVGYQGTTATLTVNKMTNMLTIAVTGGTGASLSLSLAQFTTILDLATFIASQPGYSATAVPAAQQLNPSALDAVAAIGICSTAAGDEPGRVKMAAFQFQTALATSGAVSFAPTILAGLPDPMALPAYLSGGTLGGTLAIDIVNVINQLAGIQVNIIVPLFSQNASEDIPLGITDSSSTYTIEAINVGVKNHCIQYSTPSLKRNRICVLSYWDNSQSTYDNAKVAAQTLGNFRCNLCFQQTTQDNSQGVITTFMPWFTACVAAGMQAGGFYKSITNKLANVTAITDPVGFDNGSPGDVSDALSAGMMILTNNAAGPLWVSDQTTYGYDANFVYNSMQAVYDSDIIALNLAASFQAQFVGQSLADVDAATALAYLAQLMDTYKKSKLIASSDDAPLGWKNASVTINGPEMDVNVEIKLATAIYFIPININISQVMQSA